jgi:hypothetical protein
MWYDDEPLASGAGMILNDEVCSLYCSLMKRTMKNLTVHRMTDVG